MVILAYLFSFIGIYMTGLLSQYFLTHRITERFMLFGVVPSTFFTLIILGGVI